MKKYLIPWIIIIGGVVVFGLWVTWAFVSPGEGLPAQGQFGDKYGALNTLFTGLAFVGLIAALWHERDGAEDREREHRELIDATKSQVAVSAHAAKIAAITARIEGYNVQLRVDSGADSESRHRMINERHRLFLTLDEFYQNPPQF